MVIKVFKADTIDSVVDLVQDYYNSLIEEDVRISKLHTSFNLINNEYVMFIHYNTYEVKKKESGPRKIEISTDEPLSIDQKVTFIALKEVRKEIASILGRGENWTLPNKTLHTIAHLLPQTEAELKSIYGIGDEYIKFADKILAITRKAKEMNF